MASSERTPLLKADQGGMGLDSLREPSRGSSEDHLRMQESSLLAPISNNLPNGRPAAHEHATGASSVAVSVTDSSAETLSTKKAIPPSVRINSLDVFRGLVILQSLIQPMVGYFNLSPPVTGHNNYYLSWADTTMPLFYFAIGFAMQLTLGRLRAREGTWAMCKKQFWRSRTLFVIGLVFYGMDGYSTFEGPDGFRENWWRLLLQFVGVSMDVFESLTNIAVAQICLLPVITRSLAIRIPYAFFLGGTYLLCLRYFWFRRVWLYVDGGALGGALSHSLIMLCGTFLMDFNLWMQGRLSRLAAAYNCSPAIVLAPPQRGVVVLQHIHQRPLDVQRRRVQLEGIAVLLLVAALFMGWGISMTMVPQRYGDVCFQGGSRAIVPCEYGPVISIPFVVPSDDIMSMWTMSHRSASTSLQLFMAGLSAVVYAGCYLASDVFGLQWKFLTILSSHSLLIYILRDFAFRFTEKIIPRDSPLYMIPVALTISLLINVNLAYYLHRHNINLRI